MATTQKGIYYPDDYTAVADVPEDMKDLAESVDTALGNLEDNIEQNIQPQIDDIVSEQTTQNNEIEALQTENARLKATLPTTTGSGENITLDKTAEMEFVQPPLPKGNSEQAILPTGYTQLDYIESTGTQYIDTGITADNTVEFDVTFNTSNDLDNGAYGCIFGSRQASSTKELQVTTFSVSGFQGTVRFGDGSYNAYLTKLQKINVKLENNKYYVDNVEKLTMDKVFTNNYNIYIFALNQANTATQHGTLKLYKFKLWKNGSLVRNYVPCKNASDEVGLYDLVSETFFGNSGSGTFIAGDVSTEALPNPDFEVPIQNVTGDVEVLVQNKNLAWNGWAEDFVSRINDNTKAKLETKDGRNCLFFSANAGYGDYDNKYIFKPQNGFKENTQYTLAFSEYTTSNGYANIQITYKDGTYTELSGLTSNTWNDIVKSSTANKTIEYIQVRWRSGDSWIDLDTFMVEENTTASTYTPHQEQTFTFPLGTQRLMLGDYLADDGIHHVRGRIILDGSETWTGAGNVFQSVADTTPNKGDVSSNAYSNYFIHHYYPSAITSNIQNGEFGWNSSKLLTIRNDNVTGSANFKTWLSTHNVIVEYELATEEITPYTTEQQTAYNEIKQAISYEEQTNISGSSDESNPLFSVEAYQSIKLILAS